MALILLICFEHWVRPLPIILRVHQSLNGTCVASCSSLSFCVGLFRGPFTRQSGSANSPSPSTSSPASSDILFPDAPTPFNSILFLKKYWFLILHLCTQLPISQAWRKRFAHLLFLLAENWNCFIETNPHVHCVQFDYCFISSTSNVRILLIQHHNVSSSDDFLHR